MSLKHGLGLVGRKRGMTRVFTDAGETVPVTVIEALPNRVTQIKTLESDGYRAVQITFGTRRPSRVTKAAAGHFAKAGVEPGRRVVELRLDSVDGFAVGLCRCREGRLQGVPLVGYGRPHGQELQPVGL